MIRRMVEYRVVGARRPRRHWVWSAGRACAPETRAASVERRQLGDFVDDEPDMLVLLVILQPVSDLDEADRGGDDGAHRTGLS